MGFAHFFLQKKGGAGKSTSASMWIQFMKENNFNVLSIDTDPSNHTLAQFVELGVSSLEILNKENDIDPRRFDVLMEAIFELKDDEHLIIDSGSSCFVALKAYLCESNAFDTIVDAGHEIFVHVPITGGSDVVFTSQCLDDLIASFPMAKFVVWKNWYHGELRLDGKEFEEFKVFKKNADRIAAVVEIPHKKQATFGKDIEQVLAKKQTFTVNRQLKMTQGRH